MPWDFWLIFLFLGMAVPWRGHVRLRKLLARPAIDTTEKLTLYAATIAFQWLMLGVVAWRALARGLTPAELGLAGRLSARVLVAGLLGAGIIAGLQWLNLRRMGKMEGAAPDLMRKIAILLTIAIVAATAAYAHGGHSHQLLGTVKQLSENQLTLTDTQKMDLIIELTAETKLEKAGKPATRDDLKVGARVSVHLSEDGKVAEQIKIGGASDTHQH
jgi:hypothetical protein